MKALMSYLIFLCALYPLLAQKKSIDQLEAELLSAEDTVRVLLLDDLCVQYSRKNAKKALEYGLLGLEEAKKLNYDKGLAYLCNDIGVVYGIQNNYDKALSYFLESYRHKEKMKDTAAMASSLTNVALIYKHEGDYEQALRYLHDAYDITKNISQKEKAKGLNVLAVAYTEHGEYKQAETLFTEMLQTAQTAGLPDLEAEAMKNLAWHHFQKNDLATSLEWYNKALLYETERQNPEGKAGVLMNMSRILLANGERSQALANLREAAELFTTAGNKNRLITTYVALTQACLEDMEFNRAIGYAQEGLLLAKETNIKSRERDFLLYLHKCYDSLHQKNEALTYYKGYASVKDSLLNEKKIAELASMRSQFDLDMLEKELVIKEKDLLLKSAELKKQKVTTYLATGCLLLVLTTSFAFIRKQKIKIKLSNMAKKLQERELENLRLKKIHLQEELSFKKKRLTTYTLSVVQKNNLMQEIKEDVNTICGKIDTNGISKDLQKLKTKLNYSINVDNDWEQFKLYFEQVHRDFFKILKKSYPQLTNNELRLCALVRLNMSIKEMANILGISPQSVKMARHRLRKKLDMRSEEDFNDFFLKLEQVEEVNSQARQVQYDLKNGMAQINGY
ncbi:hypothetical protein C900_05199 [Fulvivirga imtechensis AK7]|uniref:HTH luxR-type domain-containing protein n=1 Tax=Fulvivirga imtechensis AK7 TaxID=1237149 RepID=L8JWI8_9BACT|nr:tetratricopeptide repeat protein [Fulvivirga imtechensis]ELR73150.1 hypothetical protein C900_05199 [Fulvivirga imtechensis AK7]